MSDTEGTLEEIKGPLAFMSGIHGNLEALNAVVQVCQERGAQRFFVAGDLLLHGESPLEVWQRLTELGARCVRGPTDVALATMPPSKLRPKTEQEREAVVHFEQTRTRVGELILARLLRLPDMLRLGMPDGRELMVVHGSPVDPLEPFTHDMPDEEVSRLLGTDGVDTILCGGALTPFDRTLAHVTILNLGTVGSERNGRIAHFLLLRPSRQGPLIERQFVKY